MFNKDNKDKFSNKLNLKGNHKDNKVNPKDWFKSNLKDNLNKFNPKKLKVKLKFNNLKLSKANLKPKSKVKVSKSKAKANNLILNLKELSINWFNKIKEVFYQLLTIKLFSNKLKFKFKASKHKDNNKDRFKDKDKFRFNKVKLPNKTNLN